MSGIDLSPLLKQLQSTPTLHDSIATLIEGICAQLDANPAPVVLAGAIRATARDLSAAVTVGTSHIAVVPTDPLIPTLRTALEAPWAHRAAHIAAISAGLENIDLGTKVAELEAQLQTAAAQAAEVAPLTAQLATAWAQLATAQSDAAAKAQLLDAAQTALAAKDATIAARDAQLQTAAAHLDVATAQAKLAVAATPVADKPAAKVG